MAKYQLDQKLSGSSRWPTVEEVNMCVAQSSFLLTAVPECRCCIKMWLLLFSVLQDPDSQSGSLLTKRHQPSPL